MFNGNFLYELVEEEENHEIPDIEHEIVVNEVHLERIPRLFRERLQLLDFRDCDLVKRFRLTRNIISEICELVRPDIERTTSRTKAIPVCTQVLSCLTFFSSGSFQNVSSEVCGFSQPTQSRVLKSFLASFIQFKDNFIFFPFNDPQWEQNTKAKFARISGFQNCIGVMDCVHIHHIAPVGQRRVFLNRKRRISSNMQLVSGSDGEALDVVARFPGSTHDSHIWAECGLRPRLHASNIHAYLLADSGYPLEDKLLTPYRVMGDVELTPLQENYNLQHSRTRVRAEHINGVLKKTFRCLDDSGGSLQYRPEVVAKIFTACVMLHNMRVRNHVEPQPDEPPVAAVINAHADEEFPLGANAVVTRNFIADRLFNG